MCPCLFVRTQVLPLALDAFWAMTVHVLEL